MGTTSLNQPTFIIQLKAILSGGSPPFIPTGSNVNFNPLFTIITPGSGVNQVNLVYAFAGNIANGTPFTVNLYSGATDPVGNAIAMRHVTAVGIQNLSTNSAYILTAGGGTHPVLGTDSYTAQPNGGAAVNIEPDPGFTVSSGSSDTLTVTCASGTASAYILVVGRSA